MFPPIFFLSGFQAYKLFLVSEIFIIDFLYCFHFAFWIHKCYLTSRFCDAKNPSEQFF